MSTDDRRTDGTGTPEGGTSGEHGTQQHHADPNPDPDTDRVADPKIHPAEDDPDRDEEDRFDAG